MEHPDRPRELYRRRIEERRTELRAHERTDSRYSLLRLVIFLAGAILMIFNLYMTMRGRETHRVRPPMASTAEEST